MTTQNTVSRTLSSLRLSIADGIFANIFANLTGGIFLGAFALLLGCTPWQLGLIAAIPFFGNFAQILGAFLLEKIPRHKTLTIVFAAAARLSWFPLTVAVLTTPLQGFGHLVGLLFLTVTCYHFLAAISGVSWLTWMSALVPAEIRGRFFGLRNAAVGAAAMLSTLLGGLFLDWCKKHYGSLFPRPGFGVLFSIGLVCGLISLLFLSLKAANNQPAPAKTRFAGSLGAALRDRNFIKLVQFAALWSFAVNVASPFFLIYMLEELKIQYTWISLYTVLSATADLIGMWLWGHFSDRYGNKPVLTIGVTMVSAFPLTWLFTSQNPLTIVLLIPAIHLMGGFFMAGYNLCSVNLIFKTVARSSNASFFALWAACNGLAAGVGSLVGGWFANHMEMIEDGMGGGMLSGFKLLFLISGVLRFSSLIFLRQVREAGSRRMPHAIQVLRNIRSWATTLGFHPVLHFFIAASAKGGDPSPYWPIWRRTAKPAFEELQTPIEKRP